MGNTDNATREEKNDPVSRGSKARPERGRTKKDALEGSTQRRNKNKIMKTIHNLPRTKPANKNKT
jgi:hypothetical protein